MKCVTYKCVVIFILIKFGNCADKHTQRSHDDEDDSDDDNYDVNELETEFGQDEEYHPDANQARYGAVGDPIPLFKTDPDKSARRIDYGPVGGPIKITTIQTCIVPPPEKEKTKKQSTKSRFGYYPTDDFQFPPQIQTDQSEEPSTVQEVKDVGLEYESLNKMFSNQRLNNENYYQDEYSTYQAMSFYRLDYSGNFIVMNTTDYQILGFDKYAVKYSLKTRLELILCNYNVVWMHMPNAEYPKSVIYKRFKRLFFLSFDYQIVKIKFTNNKWEKKFLNLPRDFYLYDRDEKGIFFRLTPDQYTVQPTSYGGFRYILNPGVKCRMVTIGESTLFLHNPQHNYVRTLSYFNKNSLRFYFPTFIMVYECVDNQWRRYFIKKEKSK
ncbi:SVSP family protein [Theileria parva strain Muguga]|uniref:Theileria-specific sub-telomeric protein, SVSP family n=1 Tax=Theileria parva TaxID=5875 RepID=Q4N3G5_THEPA|nr:SVSP family protein [Theileria parva strain Muguga]EAN31370.1 SVSP family protein [Theileria parva strain Muguga]|eukprot:XP_763653.1 hypothetical protein [Theileria parva strain Muguga]